MKLVLRLAAIYNLLWGGWVILFPNAFFQLVGMVEPTHPMIWQGMGMVIGVYGLGYWWASANPIKHWPIVAVGFLGKIFGPLGFIINYLGGQVPEAFAYTLITNDFIWWVPFALILNEARKNRWAL
ncbi:MAG: alkyl hydroperoxide reductase [Saprospiraceae bacterium]|nr:alkyl hydroperoxide reductase [Saprospiraceae bacterium]